MLNINTVIYLSLLFFLSEMILMLAKRSEKGTQKTQDDRKSLILFWVTIPSTLTMGFFMADYMEWHYRQMAFAAIGIVLIFFGLIIRWVAIMQLSREFTVDVAIGEHHQLKSDGLYKYIRHPSYTGLMLICIGLSFAMNSLISFLVITIPVFLTLHYRIRVEENALIEGIGEEYLAYMKKTRKLIPKLY